MAILLSLFLGVLLGMVLMGACAAAGQADRRAQEEQVLEWLRKAGQ